MADSTAPRTITVTLDLAQAEAAIYALRCEAHRQDPGKYQNHPRFPDYDPWPDDMADLADDLEQQLIEAGAITITGKPDDPDIHR